MRGAIPVTSPATISHATAPSWRPRWSACRSSPCCAGSFSCGARPPRLIRTGRRSHRSWAARPKPFNPPFSAYPMALQEEIAAVRRWMEGGDRRGPFSRQGDGKPLRPATVKLRLACIRLILGVHVGQGNDPRSVTSLADLLISPAAIEAILQALWERGQTRHQARVEAEPGWNGNTGQLDAVAVTLLMLAQLLPAAARRAEENPRARQAGAQVADERDVAQEPTAPRPVPRSGQTGPAAEPATHVDGGGPGAAHPAAGRGGTAGPHRDLLRHRAEDPAAHEEPALVPPRAQSALRRTRFAARHHELPDPRDEDQPGHRIQRQRAPLPIPAGSTSNSSCRSLPPPRRISRTSNGCFRPATANPDRCPTVRSAKPSSIPWPSVSAPSSIRICSARSRWSLL